KLFSCVTEHRFRAIAWENPASPCMDTVDGPVTLTVAHAARNLEDVVGLKCTAPPHIVTWCSGALVALWAMAARRLPIASISLIAPPRVVSGCLARTAFQSHFLSKLMNLAVEAVIDNAALCDV